MWQSRGETPGEAEGQAEGYQLGRQGEGADPGGLVGVFWARGSPGFKGTDDQIHPSCSMDSGETRDLEA